MITFGDRRLFLFASGSGDGRTQDTVSRRQQAGSARHHQTGCRRLPPGYVSREQFGLLFASAGVEAQTSGDVRAAHDVHGCVEVAGFEVAWDDRRAAKAHRVHAGNRSAAASAVIAVAVTRLNTSI